MLMIRMAPNSEVDQVLIKKIRAQDGDAWQELIVRYEGRLLAFVDSRLSNRSASEDIVQEAFIGFLNSLHPLSGTSRLDFLSPHRTHPWSDGILLVFVLIPTSMTRLIITKSWIF